MPLSAWSQNGAGAGMLISICQHLEREGEGIKRTTTTSRLIRSRNVGGGLVKCVTYVTYVTYRRLIKSAF